MKEFRGQFLFTTKNDIFFDWDKVIINKYFLYFHPELNYEVVKNKAVEIHLLGNIYDWEKHTLSNHEILNTLSKANSLDDFLVQLSKYAGQFVLIYKSNEKFILLNDACAQNEIYYDTGFSAFGSQTKILEKVINPEPYKEEENNHFFESQAFLKKRIFFGEKTHRSNVKHLLPNHFICLNDKKVKRFYPTIPIHIIPVDEAAEKAARILQGTIKAVAVRNKIAMAVTAGYDSRVLFLASINLKCKYFIYKHENMGDDHYDIIIPNKLTSLFEKEFSVIPDLKKDQINYSDNYLNCIDFPRFQTYAGQDFTNHVYLNGNISEVARNYYGYHKNLNSKDFAYLSGYANSKMVIAEYENWLKNKPGFEKLGFNYLDMFYWEEKMGNWAAKAKTESNALGKLVFSPFNSRELLEVLLSTKRKYRDSHNNILYNKMINILSKETSQLPINPGRKRKIIGFMKRMKIYNLYRHIGIKLQMLQG